MPPPAISVTGEATVSVAPDQAQIDGGVTSDAKTAREASDANNAAMGKVLLALKGAGIDEKDYQTSRLSLQPQFARESKASERAGHRQLPRQQPCHGQDPRRHQGRERDRRAGGRRRQRDRRHQFHGNAGLKTLDEAREKAIADARRKAEIYAKAAGVTLGEPISISEEGAPGPLFRSKMAAPDGRRRAGGARRRNALGDGERVLGDQGERSRFPVVPRYAGTSSSRSASSASRRLELQPSCFETALRASCSMTGRRAKSPPPAPASAPRTARAESSLP